MIHTHAKVFDSFTAIPSTTDQNRVRASRGTKRKLIERQSLTTGSKDAFLCRAGKTKSGHNQLGNRKQTLIIRDCGDSNNNLALTLWAMSNLPNNTGKGDRRTMGFGKIQATENNLGLKVGLVP